MSFEKNIVDKNFWSKNMLKKTCPSCNLYINEHELKYFLNNSHS